MAHFWSKPEEEFLIHARYVSNLSWEKIAESIGRSPKQCKKHYTNLTLGKLFNSPQSYHSSSSSVNSSIPSLIHDYTNFAQSPSTPDSFKLLQPPNYPTNESISISISTPTSSSSSITKDDCNNHSFPIPIKPIQNKHNKNDKNNKKGNFESNTSFPIKLNSHPKRSLSTCNTPFSIYSDSSLSIQEPPKKKSKFSNLYVNNLKDIITTEDIKTMIQLRNECGLAFIRIVEILASDELGSCKLNNSQKHYIEKYLKNIYNDYSYNKDNSNKNDPKEYTFESYYDKTEEIPFCEWEEETLFFLRGKLGLSWNIIVKHYPIRSIEYLKDRWKEIRHLSKEPSNCYMTVSFFEVPFTNK